MSVILKCQNCGNDFSVINCRKNTAKYCSKECSNISKKGRDNCICTYCGKSFHLKPFAKEKAKRSMGFFCSKSCFYEYKKIWFVGLNNHQSGLKGNLNCSFKGLELPKTNHKNIDIMVYEPTHPYANKNGRVLKHRLIVEQNYTLFDKCFFENINGKIVLKKEVIVHHIDKNHSNNDISNLEILSRGQHTSIHNKDNCIKRDKLGRIIGVFKQGELLENRKDNDNQQPSLNRNVFEGSTTNSRV